RRGGAGRPWIREGAIVKASGWRSAAWARVAAVVLTMLSLCWGGPAPAAETTTYVLTDVQGTVLAREDAQGNIIARYDYRPYGRQQAGPVAAGPGYTGHVEDPDTKLVYMQARYYDPETRRFLTIDPERPEPGNTVSFSRYLYAANNPLRNVDPDGHAPLPALGKWLDVLHQVTAEANQDKEAFQRNVAEVVSYLPGGGLAGCDGGCSKTQAAVIIGVDLLPGRDEARIGVKGFSAALKDGAKLPTAKALAAAIDHLGAGYRQIADGVFKSQDGTRLVRMTDSDLAKAGNHAGAPHINLESGSTVVKPNGKESFISKGNRHIFLPEEK
ncbi:RHS repeat-associated core domain-containing protein, partial [Frateuria sp. MAH-13]